MKVIVVAPDLAVFDEFLAEFMGGSATIREVPYSLIWSDRNRRHVMFTAPDIVGRLAFMTDYPTLHVDGTAPDDWAPSSPWGFAVGHTEGKAAGIIIGAESKVASMMSAWPTPPGVEPIADPETEMVEVVPEPIRVPVIMTNEIIGYDRPQLAMAWLSGAALAFAGWLALGASW